MSRHQSASLPASNDARCEMPLIYGLVAILFPDINPAFLYIKSRTWVLCEKMNKHDKELLVKAVLILFFLNIFYLFLRER